MTFLPSDETIVAGASMIAAAVEPMISEETSSLSLENLICSTRSPCSDASFKSALISSTVVLDLISRFKIANDPFGTGTRIALEVSLPFNEGNTFETAVPAPVSVITILSAAARPLLDFLCILSTRF